jgi:hypothetical protein
MPFFEPLPPRPEPSTQPTGWRPPLWDRPSEAIMGAPVALAALLAKTERLAVAVGHFAAYPNGFTFHLTINGNPMTPRDPMRHGVMMGPPGMRRGPRVGFEFADGSRAPEGGPLPFQGQLMRAHAGRDDSGIPTTPVLMSLGGGGGTDGYAMRFWCFPLPPAGPMRVYLEWADADIAETMLTLDATAIVDAAPNAITLWEPED